MATLVTALLPSFSMLCCDPLTRFDQLVAQLIVNQDNKEISQSNVLRFGRPLQIVIRRLKYLSFFNILDPILVFGHLLFLVVLLG